MSLDTKSDSPLSSLLRGVLGACPNCGRGRLLHRYLKTVDRCAVCGEPYGHLRADDAPPWLTILIVGHAIVPLVLMVEQRYAPDLWIQFTVWPSLTLALTLTLLPRCKGLILALLWMNKAEGSESDPDPTG